MAATPSSIPSEFPSIRSVKIETNITDDNDDASSIASFLTGRTISTRKSRRFDSSATVFTSTSISSQTAAEYCANAYKVSNSSCYDDLRRSKNWVLKSLKATQDKLPALTDILKVLAPLVIAVALRYWRYATAERAVSIKIARGAFRQQAKLVLEDTIQRIDATRGTFQGFGTTIQQITEYSDQTWPFVTIPHWDLRAGPILEHTNADSLILAPLVDPQQWDSFYDYTGHLHEEKLHWRLHFQPLFVPYQKRSTSLADGLQASAAQNLREWYVDPDARRIMDLISKKANPAAVLLRPEHASFDYLFQPILLESSDNKGDSSKRAKKKNLIRDLVDKFFPSAERRPSKRSGKPSRTGGSDDGDNMGDTGKVVGLVAAQVRLDSFIQESLTPLFMMTKRMKRPINIDVMTVLADNCDNKITFQIVATPHQQKERDTARRSSSHFLGVGDHHDVTYDEFEIVSEEISFISGVMDDQSRPASVGASQGQECYPTSMKIHLYPTNQMIG